MLVDVSANFCGTALVDVPHLEGKPHCQLMKGVSEGSIDLHVAQESLVDVKLTA